MRHIAPMTLLVTSALLASPACSVIDTGEPLKRPMSEVSDAGAGNSSARDTDGRTTADTDDTTICSEPTNCPEADSCVDILRAFPDAADGDYTLSAGREVYCDMDNGGWTRVVDFQAAPNSCPDGWKADTDTLPADVPICVVSQRDCSSNVEDSASFDTPVLYAEVRGRFVGYQGNTPDGFTGDGGIGRAYVNGVSITHGTPRQHVFTLAVGLRQNVEAANSCPCMGGREAPDFVGDQYICDSGNPNTEWGRMWYEGHPLWDRGDCDSGDDPWFETQLDSPTEDPLEVRLMTGGCDDLFGVTEMELYVR